jgi:glycosyltransferase involved in cell wall biosynthesis
MSAPTLSIALATYNGEKYLAAQLKSVVDQTEPITELVVADDGSTDATVAILNRFAEIAAFPVRVFQNSGRLGYRVNFMNAAAACTSELVAFCDQDDIWHHDNTRCVLRAFTDPDVLLVFHNARVIDNEGRPIGKLFTRTTSKTYLPLSSRAWMIVPGLVQTLRRSLLRFTPLHPRSIDPYCPGEPMPHDLWYPFWASVFGKMVYIPDTLVQYRQHKDNTSGWQVGWFSYLRENIVNAESYAAANVMSSQNRLDLLDGARSLVEPTELPKIDAAVAFYKALHVLNERRMDIYRGNFAGRARALIALLRDGAYSRWLGYDALLLDTFIGVPLPGVGRIPR